MTKEGRMARNDYWPYPSRDAAAAAYYVDTGHLIDDPPRDPERELDDVREERDHPHLPWPAPTGPMSRPSDPDTSKAAPPSFEALSDLQREVLAAFGYGPRRGMTDDELTRLKFPHLNPGTVVKRRSELAHAGLLRDSGRRRPVERSGRLAVVWVLA